MADDEHRPMESRIAHLEARLGTVEKVVEELRSGLIGTVNNVGALELIRSTSASVQAIEKNVTSMQSTVESFRKDRWTIRGVMLSVGLLSGFLAWLSTFIVGLFAKGILK